MSELGGRINGARQRLEGGECGVLVTIECAAGSVPRDADTTMLVFAEDSIGTIGGGALEHSAQRRARAALNEAAGLPDRETIPLGPTIGQCCGGSVVLRFTEVGASNVGLLDEWFQQLMDETIPLWLFGAGHVGRAVVKAMTPLPFRLTWIDSRASIFPNGMEPEVETVRACVPYLEVSRAPAGAMLLVMTHSHAQDFDIVDSALKRADLSFIGLIGSATKRTRFRTRLQARGHSHQTMSRLICPIGIAGIAGKEPEIIAASVAAQLLQLRAAMKGVAPMPVSLTG